MNHNDFPHQPSGHHEAAGWQSQQDLPHHLAPASFKRPVPPMQDNDEDCSRAMKRLKMAPSPHPTLHNNSAYGGAASPQTLPPPPLMHAHPGSGLTRSVTTDEEQSSGQHTAEASGRVCRAPIGTTQYTHVNSFLAQLHQQRRQRTTQQQQPQSCLPRQPVPNLWAAQLTPEPKQPPTQYQPRKVKLPCNSNLG